MVVAEGKVASKNCPCRCVGLGWGDLRDSTAMDGSRSGGVTSDTSTSRRSGSSVHSTGLRQCASTIGNRTSTGDHSVLSVGFRSADAPSRSSERGLAVRARLVLAVGSRSLDPIGADLGNERAQLLACCQSHILELCASCFRSNVGMDLLSRSGYTPQLFGSIPGVGGLMHQFVCTSILINSREDPTDTATSAEHRHLAHRQA